MFELNAVLLGAPRGIRNVERGKIHTDQRVVECIFRTIRRVDEDGNRALLVEQFELLHLARIDERAFDSVRVPLTDGDL